MREFRTTKCHTHGHPEIAILLDENSDLSPDWLISFFEMGVGNGKRFEADETVQVGWMLTMLRSSSDSKYLELWEPDFDSLPINWCRGATNTLRHLIIQQSVCEELGVEPRFPSLRDAGVASPCFGNLDGSFTMSRDESDGNDSGWVLASLGYAGSEGQFLSLFELSFQQQKIVPFLALPPGSSVMMTPERIEIGHGESRSSSDSSELLRGIGEAPVFV